MWRHFRKYVSRRLRKPVASIQAAIHLKPSTLETNFLYQKCLERLYLCNDDKKMTLLLVGGPTGQKPRISEYFEVQATFLPASTHQSHQTCRKGVFGYFATSHQYSSQNIDSQILFVKKIKITTKWLNNFLSLFLAMKISKFNREINRRLRLNWQCNGLRMRLHFILGQFNRFRIRILKKL